MGIPRLVWIAGAHIIFHTIVPPLSGESIIRTKRILRLTGSIFDAAIIFYTERYSTDLITALLRDIHQLFTPIVERQSVQ